MLNFKTGKLYTRELYDAPGRSAGSAVRASDVALSAFSAEAALTASTLTTLKSEIERLKEKLAEAVATIASEHLRMRAAVNAAKFELMAIHSEQLSDVKDASFVRGMNAVMRIERKEEVEAPLNVGKQSKEPMSVPSSGSNF